MTSRPRASCAVGGLLAVALLAGCGGADDDPVGAAPAPSSTATTSPTSPAAPATGTPSRAPSAGPTKRPSKPPRLRTPRPMRTRVLAISVDGLNPDALVRLGADGAPQLTRLFDEGAGTLDARTELERTVTLPNHTGMVTGRHVDAAQGGHGVTWNDDRPGATVQAAAGGDVASVFTRVHAAGGSTAVFAGKPKFVLFERSWPDAVDRSVIDADLDALVDAATADLAGRRRSFTFVHVALPDQVGHARGFMSPAYLDAVRRADAAVGRLVEAASIGAAVSSRSGTRAVVVLTADHGGEGAGHSAPADPDNYTAPFVVWGEGVPHGDLYDLSPGVTDPGTARPGYAGPQPVRNCDLANVSLSALGLDPVPGSQCDVERAITVAAPR